MKLRRRIGALLIAAMGLFALSGCRDDETSSTPKATLYPLEIETVYAMAETAGYEGTLEDLVAMFKGEAGADGVGVETAIVEDGKLILTLTNGNMVDCGELAVKDGKDGETPTIGENGNWFIGDVDTGKSAYGEKGETGEKGDKGDQGETGAQGEQGEKGDKGDTGEKGDKGDKGDTGARGETGVGIASIKKTKTEGLVDTYTITYTDPNKASITFTVTNARSIERTEIDENGDLIVYYNDNTNQNLGRVTGEKGETGDNGKTPVFRVEDGWMQWKYETEADTEWKNLCETDGTPLPEGLSRVTYIMDGGVMPTGVPSEISVTTGSSIVLPAPSYQGYTFMGWYENLDDMYPVSETYRVHGNVKLYAKWEAGATIVGEKIYNLNDLAKVKNNLSGVYVLMNDIDCGGLGLPAIGTDSTSAFTGIFEGQGYTLSNYTVSVGEYMGLFGYSTGIIRNLNVADFKVEQKTSMTYSTLRAAGLVAYNGGTVQQCSAQKGVVDIQLDITRRAALLVGENNGTIENCYATGTVSVKQTSDEVDNEDYALAGGIAGANIKTIKNCYVNAQIYAYGFDGDYGNGSSASRYHKGVAALIAGENNGTIQNCLIYGRAEGNQYTGDISASGGGTVQNCYKDEDLVLIEADMLNTYATAQSKTQLSSAAFYAVSLGWDSEVWNFENISLVNGSYPTLKYNA